jgi:hypothetical protein
MANLPLLLGDYILDHSWRGMLECISRDLVPVVYDLKVLRGFVESYDNRQIDRAGRNT